MAVEPTDWSFYASLTLGGCTNEGDGVTHGMQPRDRADFFTVYGVTHDGYSEALLDIHLSLEEARHVAASLHALSNLPLNEDPRL